MVNLSRNKNLLLKNLANLQLAIALLLVIGVVIAVGTIIEQDQAIDYYKLNYSNSFFYINVATWEFLLGFGLDHVYSTWWYLALLVLFGTCLLSCTFVQQLPTLKVARKTFFQTSTVQFKKQKFNSILQHTSFFKILLKLSPMFVLMGRAPPKATFLLKLVSKLLFASGLLG